MTLEKLNVALVYDWVPYPVRSGDHRRVCEMIEVLREHGIKVHLLVTAPVPEKARELCRKHVDALHVFEGRNPADRAIRLIRRKCSGLLYHARMWSAARRRKRKEVGSLGKPPPCPKGLDNFVAETAARYNWHAVIVDYLWLHPAINHLPAGILRVLDAIDIQHRRTTELKAGGMRDVDTLTSEDEALIMNRFDTVIAIQEEEAAAIRKMCPGLRVITVGASTSSAIIGNREPVEGRVLFVGGHNPLNIDGLGRFIDTCWPNILTAVPEAELRVCGTVCYAFSREEFEGVIMAGPVEDIDAEYAAAQVIINPVRFGTGLKLKTVESLARGLPFVSTPKGIEGMAGNPADACVVAESDSDFTDAVVKVLTDRSLRDRLDQSASRYASDYLSHDYVYRELLDLLRSVSPAGGDNDYNDA